MRAERWLGHCELEKKVMLSLKAIQKWRLLVLGNQSDKALVRI